MIRLAPRLPLLTLQSAIALAFCLSTATHADFTLDRRYEMGDGSVTISAGTFFENAADGQTVGSGFSGPGGPIGGFTGTIDSVVGNGPAGDTTGDGEPLIAATVGGSLPTYVEYGVGLNPARPFAADASNNFGIELDGDDWLSAFNLNDPSIEPAGAFGTGYASYPGTQDRGFQLWVYPTAVTGIGQVVVDDGDEHGLNVTGAGAWQPEVRENTQNAGPVAINEWTHIQQVHDSVGLGGAITYVNGVAAATQTLDYDSDEPASLIVGANSESSVGAAVTPPDLAAILDPETNLPIDTPDFFTGIVDELEMFVIDDGTTYGRFDYATDNGYFRNVELPSRNAAYAFVDGNGDGANDNTWVPGDINFDGAFTPADIAAFAAGWLSDRADIAGSGPQVGDYTTLALGDLDLDGDTDLGDWIQLRIINQAAGAGFAVPSIAELQGVPEPTSLALASLAGGVAIARGDRRRSKLR
ncbi:MAG: LamG-like jellyroll fold domain-containing protein [Planctomycetota bacterium]